MQLRSRFPRPSAAFAVPAPSAAVEIDTHTCGAAREVWANPNLMLNLAITFLVIALIAAILGFGGIAGTAVGIAKILFFVFLVLFVVSLLVGRRTPRV